MAGAANDGRDACAFHEQAGLGAERDFAVVIAAREALDEGYDVLPGIDVQAVVGADILERKPVSGSMACIIGSNVSLA